MVMTKSGNTGFYRVLALFSFIFFALIYRKQAKESRKRLKIFKSHIKSGF